jgi:hypothetical protein
VWVDLFIRNDPLAKARARLLRLIRQQEAERLGRLGIGPEDWGARVVGSQSGALPALDAVLEGARAHVRDAILHRTDRKLRTSDGGDIFHFAYIPYVDWFRCDGHIEVAREIRTAR